MVSLDPLDAGRECREAMELSGRKFINTDDRFRFTLSSIAAALWPERNEMSSPVDAVAGNKLW